MYSRKGFVDAIWIRQRMDRTDARIQAAARLKAERASFHAFLSDPATGPQLDALLADNARIDAALAVGVVELEIVPPSADAPRGPVVDVVLVPKPGGGQ